MTYYTKVQKVKNPDGSLFMVKVRLNPEYDGDGADIVHAMTEEGAAIEALHNAYDEQPDESDEACEPAEQEPADEPDQPAETENPAPKATPKAAAKKATKKK